MVVLIACAVLGLPRAGAREACKCGFFKEMTRWMSVRTIVSLWPRGRGGAGVKYLVMRGEGVGAGAEVARGGGWSRGEAEIEHVQDCERPFGGRGLRLRLARGSAFQR